MKDKGIRVMADALGGKVVDFPGETVGPVSVSKVLDAAKECSEVIVIGLTSGDEIYLASSTGDEGLMLWLVERFKRELMRRY